MRIFENIWQVGGEGCSSPDDAAIYLVADEDKAVLIDAGTGRGYKQVVANISKCLPAEVSVERLFLTHCHFDHTGGAADLKKEYGLKIIAHKLDACFLEKGDDEVTAASWYNAALSPLDVDYKIGADSETFKIGAVDIKAFHWPGHSPGSIILLMERFGKRIVFGQDVHGPLHPSLLSNRDDYLISLNMIMELEADILCEGHYGVIEGKEEVRRFIAQFVIYLIIILFVQGALFLAPQDF